MTKDYSDFIGKQFGKLTVVEIYPPDKNSQGRQVLCKCSCQENKITVTRLNRLRDGKVKSCGCAKKDNFISANPPRLKDYSYLVGQQFGKLTVIEIPEFEPKTKRKIKCQCSCPNETILLVRLSSLQHKLTTSCGLCVPKGRKPGCKIGNYKLKRKKTKKKDQKVNINNLT